MLETRFGFYFKIPAFFYLYLFLECFQLCAAQNQFSLNVQLFDHNYGDFKSDFDETAVIKCGGKVKQFYKGMVEDTLGFDSVLNQKLLIPKAPFICADSLEKWFDARTSKTTSCGSLTLENIGSAQNPDFKYFNSNFFLMDSASQQINWTNKNGTVLTHDFSYCMEVSASMKVGTGQTMKFQSDDDLFVYLDNRLVVDQGGAHFAIETVTNLDTLKFLQSKKGKNIDVDIFYCSRVPPTSQLGMETNFVLNPQSVKRLSIVDSAGKLLRSQDVVVGKSKLCSRGNYQSLAKPICGEKTNPLDSALVKADWDLNGKIISNPGGSECIYLTPEDFPKQGRLNLTATTESKTSRISISMINPAAPKSGILKGHGRAESVEVSLDTLSTTVSDGLQVRFHMLGKTQSAYLVPTVITSGQSLPGPFPLGQTTPGQTLAGPIDFQNEIAFGKTSFNPLLANVFQSIFGHQLESQVFLQDGISPILMKANLSYTTQSGYSAFLEGQVSEALFKSLPDSLPTAFLFQGKNSKGEIFHFDAAALPCTLPITGCFRFGLTGDLTNRFLRGDSLSLSNLAKDSSLNFATPYYVPIQFPEKYLGQVGEITFLENPVHAHLQTSGVNQSALIPMTQKFQPILSTQSDLISVNNHGPVFVFPTNVPLTKIAFSIYDNFGNFVNSVSRNFSEADWNSIRAYSQGDTTWMNVMWVPMSKNGSKLATGVYIVQGDVESRAGVFIPGLNGRDQVTEAAHFHFKPKLFGYLRN